MCSESPGDSTKSAGPAYSALHTSIPSIQKDLKAHTVGSSTKDDISAITDSTQVIPNLHGFCETQKNKLERLF